MKAIFKKEIRSHFSDMTTYVIIAFMLFMVGIFAEDLHFTGMITELEYSLYSVLLIFVITIPLLTMRSFACERSEGTDRLLYSLPIKLSKIVLGKYFSMLTVFFVPVAIICLYPLILSMFGTVNMLKTYAFILAFFLLGAALIAIGMFLSSVTENQVIAAVLSLGVLLVVYLLQGIAQLVPDTALASLLCISGVIVVLGIVVFNMTKNFYAALSVSCVFEIAVLIVYFIKDSLFKGLFGTVLEEMSLFTRLDSFLDGTFDVASIVYFISVTFIFIFLTVQSLEKKRVG